MKNKKLIILSVIIIIILILPVINFLSDDYGVFGRKYDCVFSTEVYQNDQHLKLNRLCNKDLPAYDSLIYGESQAQVISTEKLGSNWYNLASMSYSPYEFIGTMEYLKANGVKINNILLHLQTEMVFWSKDSTLANKKKYALSTGFPFKNSEKFKFYLSYLFISPFNFDKSALKMNTLYKMKVLNDGSFTGKDDLLVKKYPHGSLSFENGSDFEYMSEDIIPELKKIKEYCDDNGINLKVFFAPECVKSINHYNSEQVFKFKKQLAEITPFYDFSGENEITLDDENYIDGEHFSSTVGNMILDRIYFSDSSKEPKIKGFGRYITQD